MKNAASQDRIRLTIEQMLERLIALDTTSAHSNLAFVRFVENYLTDWGIGCRLSYDDDGSKANILARIGPDVPGGVVLSGHTDVVPVRGQPWTTDPFALAEKDGRLYGRGTADMKGFIAVALAMVPEFLDMELKRPIHLALSYDEEIGCFGVPRLLESLTALSRRPAVVIVGEPSGMRIVNAHKGVRIYRTVVTGVDTHSSLPAQGVNAVVYAAELVAFLAELEVELRERPGPTGDEAAYFDPPYGTLNVGRIEGGLSQNVVPRECLIVWETRLLPWQDPDEILQRLQEHADTLVLPRMRENFTSPTIVTETICDVPGLRPEADSPAEQLCIALLGSNATYSVPFGSEAGLFQNAGFPTIICGPGEIAQAHGPNEYIERTQLAACADFLRRLAEHLATNHS